MTKKIYSFRLDEALVSRIDALGVKRGKFVRDAIEAALGAGDHLAAFVEVAGTSRNEILDDIPMKPAPKKISNVPVGDEDRLLEYLRCGIRTERDAVRALGWTDMRVSKAVARLGAAGRVRFKAGGIEVI